MIEERFCCLHLCVCLHVVNGRQGAYFCFWCVSFHLAAWRKINKWTDNVADIYRFFWIWEWFDGFPLHSVALFLFSSVFKYAVVRVRYLILTHMQLLLRFFHYFAIIWIKCPKWQTIRFFYRLVLDSMESGNTLISLSMMVNTLWSMRKRHFKTLLHILSVIVILLLFSPATQYQSKSIFLTLTLWFWRV